jgi:hypothetical protein
MSTTPTLRAVVEVEAAAGPDPVVGVEGAAVDGVVLPFDPLPLAFEVPPLAFEEGVVDGTRDRLGAVGTGTDDDVDDEPPSWLVTAYPAAPARRAPTTTAAARARRPRDGRPGRAAGRRSRSVTSSRLAGSGAGHDAWRRGRPGSLGKGCSFISTYSLESDVPSVDRGELGTPCRSPVILL